MLKLLPWALLAGAGYAGYRFVKRAGERAGEAAEAVASAPYRAASALTRALTGDADATLGTKLYDLKEALTRSAPDVNKGSEFIVNPATGVVLHVYDGKAVSGYDWTLRRFQKFSAPKPPPAGWQQWPRPLAGFSSKRVSGEVWFTKARK